MLPIIFVSTTYWISNLNNLFSNYVQCVCIIILVANCAGSFGKNFKGNLKEEFSSVPILSDEKVPNETDLKSLQDSKIQELDKE